MQRTSPLRNDVFVSPELSVEIRRKSFLSASLSQPQIQLAAKKILFK
jgi:hypothetical protein